MSTNKTYVLGAKDSKQAYIRARLPPSSQYNLLVFIPLRYSCIFLVLYREMSDIWNAAYRNGEIMVVGMDEVLFNDFRSRRCLGTEDLNSCSVAMIVSEYGAILAHIAPRSPTAGISDMEAGTRFMKRKMDEVVALYHNYQKYFPAEKVSCVVTALYRGEVALPDQEHIMAEKLRDVGLDPVVRHYHVSRSTFSPPTGTVLIDARDERGMPRVYIADQEITMSKSQQTFPQNQSRTSYGTSSHQPTYTSGGGRERPSSNYTSTYPDESAGYTSSELNYGSSSAGHGDFGSTKYAFAYPSGSGDYTTSSSDYVSGNANYGYIGKSDHASDYPGDSRRHMTPQSTYAGGSANYGYAESTSYTSRYPGGSASYTDPQASHASNQAKYATAYSSAAAEYGSDYASGSTASAGVNNIFKEDDTAAKSSGRGQGSSKFTHVTVRRVIVEHKKRNETFIEFKNVDSKTKRTLEGDWRKKLLTIDGKESEWFVYTSSRGDNYYTSTLK